MIFLLYACWIGRTHQAITLRIEEVFFWFLSKFFDECWLCLIQWETVEIKSFKLSDSFLLVVKLTCLKQVLSKKNWTHSRKFQLEIKHCVCILQLQNIVSVIISFANHTFFHCFISGFSHFSHTYVIRTESIHSTIIKNMLYTLHWHTSIHESRTVHQIVGAFFFYLANDSSCFFFHLSTFIRSYLIKLITWKYIQWKAILFHKRNFIFSSSFENILARER